MFSADLAARLANGDEEDTVDEDAVVHMEIVGDVDVHVAVGGVMLVSVTVSRPIPSLAVLSLMVFQSLLLL